MTPAAAQWIDRLGLQPHPEGGYFRETYRSGEQIGGAGLPSRYGGARSLCTAIYFLLEGPQFSAFHRLRSDELWFFHAGTALRVWEISPGGALKDTRLGPDPSRGHTLQVAIPRGAWFAAQPEDPQGYTLIGCTVAPGFDFADFELARRDALAEAFPAHRELIRRLTRA